MAVHSYNMPLLLKKVSGLAAIILGFLLTAAGYRYGSPEFTTVGIAILALGLVSLVLMIVRRNQ